MVGVAIRQSPTEPNPRRGRGAPVRLLDSSPMAPLGRRWGGGGLQWWCSPQSSVPRQTVGHHARAATDELERCEPAKAAARGRPARAGRPPRRAFFHIPTDRRAGRGTPAGVPAPAVASRKTRSVWASLKIDSRPRETHLENPAPAHLRARAPGSSSLFLPLRPFSLFSSLPPSYTHRRARRAVHARRGSRAGGRIPQNPICMRLAKNRLTGARAPPDPKGGRGRLDAAPQGATHRPATRHPRAGVRTRHLPCTYPVPTLYLPRTYPAPNLNFAAL